MLGRPLGKHWTIIRWSLDEECRDLNAVAVTTTGQIKFALPPRNFANNQQNIIQLTTGLNEKASEKKCKIRLPQEVGSVHRWVELVLRIVSGANKKAFDGGSPV